MEILYLLVSFSLWTIYLGIFHFNCDHIRLKIWVQLKTLSDSFSSRGPYRQPSRINMSAKCLKRTASLIQRLGDGDLSLLFFLLFPRKYLHPMYFLIKMKGQWVWFVWVWLWFAQEANPQAWHLLRLPESRFLFVRIFKLRKNFNPSISMFTCQFLHSLTNLKLTDYQIIWSKRSRILYIRAPPGALIFNSSIHPKLL